MSMHYDSALVDRGRSPRLFALLVNDKPIEEGA